MPQGGKKRFLCTPAARHGKNGFMGKAPSSRFTERPVRYAAPVCCMVRLFNLQRQSAILFRKSLASKRISAPLIAGYIIPHGLWENKWGSCGSLPIQTVNLLYEEPVCNGDLYRYRGRAVSAAEGRSAPRRAGAHGDGQRHWAGARRHRARGPAPRKGTLYYAGYAALFHHR